MANGRIEAVGPTGSVRIPPGVTTIDCAGLTITAGFWNGHVHFTERKWAQVAGIPAPELAGQIEEMLTRYGFTSLFDTGSMWENTRGLRERIEPGDVPGPRIRSTGEVIFPRGGAPPDLILDVKGTMSLRCSAAPTCWCIRRPVQVHGTGRSCRRCNRDGSR